jgi:hypothetical protein
VHYDPCIPEAFVIAAWDNAATGIATSPPHPRSRSASGTSGGRVPAIGFTAEETVPLLNQYRRYHPLAWKIVAPMLGLPTDPTEPTWQARAATIRPVVFIPRRDSP